MSKEPEFDYSKHSDADLIAAHTARLGELSELQDRFASLDKRTEEAGQVAVLAKAKQRELNAIVTERQRRDEASTP